MFDGLRSVVGTILAFGGAGMAFGKLDVFSFIDLNILRLKCRQGAFVYIQVWHFESLKLKAFPWLLHSSSSSKCVEFSGIVLVLEHRL
jgi:hypothetical protein